MTEHWPNPDEVADGAEFVAAMRKLKTLTGLSYRVLESRAARAGDSLPTSTLNGTLARDCLPRAEIVEAFVRACGGDGATVQRWTAARARLVVSDPSPVPEEKTAEERASEEKSAEEKSLEENAPEENAPEEKVDEEQAVTAFAKSLGLDPEQTKAWVRVTRAVDAEPGGAGEPRELEAAGPSPTTAPARRGWPNIARKAAVVLALVGVLGVILVTLLQDAGPGEAEPGPNEAPRTETQSSGTQPNAVPDTPASVSGTGRAAGSARPSSNRVVPAGEKSTPPVTVTTTPAYPGGQFPGESPIESGTRYSSTSESTFDRTPRTIGDHVGGGGGSYITLPAN